MNSEKGSVLASRYGITIRELLNILTGYESDNGVRVLQSDFLDFNVDSRFVKKIDEKISFYKSKLVNETDIINNSAPNIPITQEAGIYFLLDGRRIVYVGQSINVVSRIASHIDDGKIFDHVCFIPTEKKELSIIESLYISSINPPLNIASLQNRVALKMVIDSIRHYCSFE